LQSFINTANHKVTGLFVLPTAGTVTAANVKVGISRLLETCVIPTGEAMAVVKVCSFVVIRSSCLGLARAVAAAHLLTMRSPTQEHARDDKDVLPLSSPNEKYVPDLFRLPIPDIGTPCPACQYMRVSS